MVKLTCFTKHKKNGGKYTTCLEGQKKPKKQIEKPKAKTPLKKKEPAFSFGDVMGKVGGGTKEKGYRKPAKAKPKPAFSFGDVMGKVGGGTKEKGYREPAKGTHKMPDGTVMSGKTHSKDSKPVKPKSVEKSVEPPKKSTETFLDKPDVKAFLKMVQTEQIELKKTYINKFNKKPKEDAKGRTVYFSKQLMMVDNLNDIVLSQTSVEKLLKKKHKELAKKGAVRTTTLINDVKRHILQDNDGLKFSNPKKGDMIITQFIEERDPEYKFL